MKNHEGCKRAFYWSSRAWHANANRNKNPTIMFGMYHKDGGTSGEMAMEWINLGNKITPQLKCFDDAWSALGLFTDIIKEMANVDSGDITQEQFVEILKECSFEDLTEYEDPCGDDDGKQLERNIKDLENHLEEAKIKLSNMGEN